MPAPDQGLGYSIPSVGQPKARDFFAGVCVMLINKPPYRGQHLAIQNILGSIPRATDPTRFKRLWTAAYSSALPPSLFQRFYNHHRAERAPDPN